MSDALPLPPRPNVEQYRKLAKDLQDACQSAKPGAVRAWAERWATALARLFGPDLTPALRERIAIEVDRLDNAWRTLKQSNEAAGACKLSAAQFLVARGHGFASWPKFTAHLKALGRADSPVSRFESAADAIASGDTATLAALLQAHPGLVRERSTREHRSTLLHYVSANGIEDFRQRTPPNIVEIATLLLQGGADVNAESDAYGGRSTTLGLTATSCHPANAGVMIPLLELLLSHGAVVDVPGACSAVVGCLHNGRAEEAAFLAGRGAHLDLEGAAGVGRLDVVKTFFHADGSLTPPATRKQLLAGFGWACGAGHLSVVEYLLRHGAGAADPVSDGGETGLHWAALEGQAGIVRLLLEHGAPVNLRDATHESTPLEWALYNATGRSNRRGRERYSAVVALLVRAGGELHPEWYASDPARRRAGQEMIREALDGGAPAG